MTAEIAILNKSGVALAADSAVTVGSTRQSKVFNSANKLFTLSKYHPVGIMIYGNAEFMSIPWETIIKMYRNTLGQTHHARLSDYAGAFIDFLSSRPQFQSPESEMLHVYKVFNAHLNQIVSKVNRRMLSEFDAPGPSEEQVAEMFLNESEKHVSKMASEDYIIPEKEGAIDEFLDKYLSLINTIIEQEVHFDIDEDTKNQLILVAYYAVVKNVFIEDISGVVVAGYGEDEIYPSIAHYQIEGMYSGVLKYRMKSLDQIDAINKALIKPFAQQEMVHSFLGGIDPALQSKLFSAVESVLYNLSTLTENGLSSGGSTTSLTDDDKASLDAFGQVVYERLKESWTKYQNDFFMSPIKSSVSILPKEELAAMAEALVNLTSFKRRVTISTETVGGPIDVAVISKGDGFVWIKRKHYFDANLNHHFFRNYMRGDSDD